jgi:peptidylprolyl isomerase
MHTSRALRILSLFALLLAAALLATACGDGDSGGDSGSDDTTEVDSAADEEAESDDSASDDAAGGGGEVDEDVAARNDKYDKAPTTKLDPAKKYTVHMKTSKGTFDIVLDQKAGPIAAANFAFLVKEGFYDGIVFHRVIKDFMVQTGDPTGTGTGGPGYSIKDDKVEGSYTRGTVAMANAGPDTGGSQFFIIHQDYQLPPDYAIFGHVDEAGMKVVDKIASVEVGPGGDGAMSAPVETVKIISATLEES